MAPKRVLVLCNSESGVANVFLATAHALLELEPTVQIHIASFPALGSAVTATSASAVQSSSAGAAPFTFHELGFPCTSESMLAREPALWRLFGARPGFGNAHQYAQLVSWFFVPWDASTYVRVYRRVADLLAELRPDLALVDGLFGLGLTACREAGIPVMHVSPNSIKDVAGHAQPHLAALWKYPAFGSGFKYPVPWYCIPLNIYINLCLGLGMLLNGRLARTTEEIEKSLGVKVATVLDFLGRTPENTMLLGCCREMDFPVDCIPDKIVPCGPILRPAPPVEAVDPELSAWLGREPTVFVNLGTLSSYSEADAIEMAGALKILLQACPQKSDLADLQVLWKLRKDGDYSTERGSEIYSILGPEIDADRVRITKWVVPEPGAVLESGSVVCSVHHGGAGSYSDAVTAGVPHVVLPVWADTYDYGPRVEFLGIGRWGSRTASPKCKADELGPVLVDVVLGPEAGDMKRRARELAQVCVAKGKGRDVAAREVLARLKTAEG